MNAPFEIVAGSPESTVIIHVPHSSRAIPDDVRAGIVLDGAALEAELDAMTDSFTDVIAEQVARLTHLRPWIFVNRRSRLVVDPERFPDDREEMNAVGMGAVYTRTSTGEVLREVTADEVSGLVDRFFTPYAMAFADLVSLRATAAGRVTIIDLHSFPLDALPYELHGDGARPEICLGTDDFHTHPSLLEAARDALSEFDVDADSPFSGCYVPMTHYRSDDSVAALMIEVRRDLYMGEWHQLVELAVAPIAAGVATLVNRIDQTALVTCQGMGGFDTPTSEETE